MEAGEEDREPLVQGVDHAELAVLLQVRPGRCVLGDAEGWEHAPAALVGVGRHPGAGTEAPDCLLQGLVSGPAPVCQAAEPVSGVVRAADDAGLAAGDAPGMDGSAVPVGSPRHPGFAPCPVAREGLVEIGPVDLPGDRRPCPEGQKRSFHDLAEPHAAEPGGAQADVAGPGALPEAPAGEGRLHEEGPGRGIELGGGEQAPALGREGAPALPAEPPLGPVAIVALPDEGGGPAPGTGLGGRIACRPAELPRDRRLRRIDELALLLEGEPLHLMEYDIQHPVSVSLMSMFGDIHLRAEAGHYCVNAGLTESYEITNVKSHYAMDVAGASQSNNANVQLYNANGSLAQIWDLKRIERTVADGLYQLGSLVNSGKVIDVSGGSLNDGAAVQIYGSNSTLAQYWTVSYDAKSGYYVVRSAASGKVLDCKWGGTASGTKIQQYSANGSAAQWWRFVKNADGSYSILSAKSGLALDIPGAQAHNGSILQLYASNGSNAQKWALAKAGPLVADGYYQIVSRLDSDCVIDVNSGSKAEDAKFRFGIQTRRLLKSGRFNWTIKAG